MGFSVPISGMFSPSTMAYGAGLGLVAMLSKYLAGFMLYKFKDVIGWAMASRGELGFLVANQLFVLGRISEFAYMMAIWALLLSNIFPPIALRYSLEKIAHQHLATPPSNKSTPDNAAEKKMCSNNLSKLVI